RRTFKLPLREPQLFSRAVHALEIVNTVVRDEHFEPEPRIVVVPEDPVDHVATITRARRANTIAIDKRVATKNIRDAVHQVNIRLPAPVATNLIYKLLTITRRATR